MQETTGNAALAAASKEACKEMLKYSTPLVPNNLMWWIVNALNRPVMETFLGLEAIGLFAVANKFPTLISTCVAMISGAWQISVMEEFGKENYRVFFNKVMRLMILLMILSSYLLSIFSYTLINVVVDNNYIDSWIYIPILSLSPIFMAISTIAGSNFSATKESKFFFYSSLWGAITAIVMNYILIPIYGIMGACFAVVLSFISMAISRCYYCKKYVSIDNYFRVFFSILCNIIAVYIIIQDVEIFIKTIMVGVSFSIILIINFDIIKECGNLLKFKIK